MSISSWWKKRTQREDKRAMHDAEERSYESPEERRNSSSDIPGRGADEVAARRVHEGNIDAADRLSEF